ncbi:MAG TPA: peptidylprolyl isomerase, partial [Acidimicrobiales bacterium]|nr:peptidylprolyl isomerase [Acidimicrobiales bacterium]
MKWLLVLLILLGGGVAAAALTVPTNAAVVNGSAISQQTLNSDISAIVGSPDYQCYLTSEDYLSSNGNQVLPPITGAGQGQNVGDNPTANSAFVATYLDTEIGHELVLYLATTHHVTVTPEQLTEARANLVNQIDGVMSQVSQTAQGQNPRFSCGSPSPLTGQVVLASLPASFVDAQVQFVATASALQEDLAGVGSSEGQLEGYYERHRAQFDTACFNAAEYSSESAAKQAQASIDFGTPFAQVASSATQSGTIPCTELVAVAGELGAAVSTLQGLAVGKASAPISVSGNYVVLELSKRTPT